MLINSPYFFLVVANSESMGGAVAILLGVRLQVMREKLQKEKDKVQKGLKHPQASNNDKKEDNEFCNYFQGEVLLAPAIHNSVEPPRVLSWVFRRIVFTYFPDAPTPFSRKHHRFFMRGEDAIDALFQDPLYSDEVSGGGSGDWLVA